MAIDLSKVPVEELEKALQAKKEDERRAHEKKKANYENRRDDMVTDLISEAVMLNEQLADFKARVIKMLFEFRNELQEYGGIRKNSKGGYQIRHRETQHMVVLSRNSRPEYDERVSLAEGLIKDFLSDTIKKQSAQTYNTIAALLERNKKGDYTPSRVADLLKIRDNYSDPRWQKAMKLFEESFTNREISYSAEFYRKDSMGKDVMIGLSFAGIPVELPEMEVEE
jgi:hypothetical protein